MSDTVGVNKSGFISQDIVLGKEVGTFSKKEEAEKEASYHSGSEVIYQKKDNTWQVTELKEKGVLFGKSNLSNADSAKITIDRGKLKNAVISFKENDVSYLEKLSLPDKIINPLNFFKSFSAEEDTHVKNILNKAGWLKKEGKSTKDCTPEFNELYESAKSGKNILPPDAKNNIYLFIQGLYGNQLPGYMESNSQKLKDSGLDVLSVKTDTGAGVEKNAETVRDAILDATRSGKKVVIIAHSKGGLDSTAAISMYPELKQHIRALIAMQSPYGGTPIASDIVAHPELKTVVDQFADFAMDASPQSLRDLTYDSRIAFLKKHPYPDDIPTVSLTSSRKTPLSGLFNGEEYMWYRYKLPSDGLVPSIDMEIPGSKVVKLEDMDHADSSFTVSKFNKYDPGSLTQALVTIALSK